MSATKLSVGTHCHRCGEEWSSIRIVGNIKQGNCAPCGITLQQEIRIIAVPAGPTGDFSTAMSAKDRAGAHRTAPQSVFIGRRKTASEECRLKVLTLCRSGMSHRDAAKAEGISRSQVQRICAAESG